MGQMAEKICLDTDMCIAFLNNEPRSRHLIEKIGNRNVFVSAITLFELNLRRDNLDKVRNFLNDTFVLYFDELAAVKASELFKNLKSKGKMISLNDIFIASTAIVNNCSLATFNNKHFSKIEQLELYDLS